MPDIGVEIPLDAEGYTLSAQLKNSSNVNVGSPITAGFTDDGGGFYYWVFSPPADFRGRALIYADGGSEPVSAVALNKEEYESAAAAIGSARVAYNGPVAPDGDVQIIRGDAYYHADGRALAWVDHDGNAWPSLAGNLGIVLRVRRPVEGTIFTKSGGVANPTDGPGATVRAPDLTSAETQALLPADHKHEGVGRFSVVATLASGRPLTLKRGRFVIEPDLR